MFSMNIIYLDTLFLVNFICDYILLLCSARIAGAVIHRPLFIISASIGGLYACLCTIPSWEWMNYPIVKIICCAIICIIAFWNEHKLLRCIAVFPCMSSMVGGLLTALSIPYGALLYLPIDLNIVFPTFAFVYIVMTKLFHNFPEKQLRECHTVNVTLGNRTVSFSALHDTGNELFDPISNKPVLICEKECLQPLFPEQPLFSNDPYFLFYLLNETGVGKHRMKLIPYKTINNSGILLGFKPDTLYINDRESPHIIAFATESFSESTAYQAIY